MGFDRNAYKREWNKKNPDSHRKAHLKNRYGISVADYEALCDLQDGCCAICLKPRLPGSRHLAVDHCHKTNLVRGALCGACNRGLGLFEDDDARLLRAAAYLKRHKLQCVI